MSLLNFTINGKNSYNDFGWVIKESNHEELVKKRYESIPIPGRIGNLIIPDEGKDNFIIEIEFATKLKGANPQLYWNTVLNWLNPNVDYAHMMFNDGYQFEVILAENITPKRLNCGGRTFTVKFEAIPIDPTSSKYVISDKEERVLLTDSSKGIEVV